MTEIKKTNIKEQQINEMATVLNTEHYFTVPYATEVATILYKAGYRKQEDTVKEFAEKLKDTITEEIALCEQKRSELLYGGQWIVLTEKKIVLMVQIKMLNELAEQYGKEE